MKFRINRQLLPNIKFLDSEDRIFEYSGKETPLEQAIYALKETKKSLFLVAMGGQGKTTTLRTLWLDFLRGKNDIPCLYVDCKLLDKADKDKAIASYIEKEYKINIIKSGCKSIILLDGVNEANANLRQLKGGIEECFLLKECNELISLGFKLIISGRSQYITERLKETDYSDKREFDDNIMQYCELCELSEKQLVRALGKEIEDSSLCKLLKNNMMLSIYMSLDKKYGEEIDKNITAGKLLEKYFHICFKTRFIQSVLKLEDNERKIFEKIKEVEKRLVDNPNGRFQDATEREISEKILYFKEIYDYLIDNSGETQFSMTNLSTKMYLPVLEHLSILQITDEDEYIWANEIYQEYFKARKYYYIFKKIEEIGFSDELETFETSLKDMLKHEQSAHYFNILKLVGELLDITDVRIAKLISLLDNNYIFRKCLAVMSALCGLGLPEEIKYIEDSTFSKCQDLRKIDLTQVIAIGDEAFANCNLLEEVIFQDGKDLIETLRFKKFLESIVPMRVGRIGERAFRNCKKLKSITIPETFRTIDEAAFTYCDSLETVSLPQTIVWIDDAAFRGCKKLKEINITGVDLNVHLGEDVFSGCESLVSVNLSYGVRDVGEYAFSECKALKNITLPLSVHEIKKCTFRFCKSLETVVLPEQLEVIGEGAFWGCESLKVIILPESLIKIGETAFEYCIALQEITLPENLQEVDMTAFMYCRELKKIYISVNTNIVSYKNVVDGFYACHAKIIRY